MRPEVAAQRKIHPSNIFFLPSDVAGNGINANAHDLGIVSGEFFNIQVRRRNLSASGRCPVEGIEDQNHVPSAFEVAEPESSFAVAQHRWQLKIGGHFTGF
jgi:hypothetical protein